MLTKSRHMSLNLLLALCLFIPGATMATAQTPDTVDVRIWTVNEGGFAVFDVCYELAGYSQVGCDENRDGNVLFEDIPHGRYVVVASYPDGSDHRVAPFHIEVNAGNNDFTTVAESRNQTYPPGGLVQDVTDVHLITRDPDTGASLTDVCYELVGYSKIGCDENADGHVTFADIPYGNHTVRQTKSPEGYDPMGDYEITLQQYPNVGEGPVIISLVQAETQGAENSTNISVVLVDETTGKRVASPENCVIIPDKTNQGCDNAVVDGQIDFIGVDLTHGQPALEVISLACGYRASGPNNSTVNTYGEYHLTLVQNVVPNGERCG